IGYVSQLWWPKEESIPEKIGLPEGLGWILDRMGETNPQDLLERLVDLFQNDSQLRREAEEFAQARFLERRMPGLLVIQSVDPIYAAASIVFQALNDERL